MFSSYTIRKTKLGKFNYNDILTYIVKCKNYSHVDKILENMQFKIIKDEKYLDFNSALKIIISANTKSSVNFCKINYNKLLCIFDTNIHRCQLLNYNEFNIPYFDVNGVKWYKAKNIAVILKYRNTKSAILSNVSNDNKTSFISLITDTFELNHLIICDNFIDPQSLFINDIGIIELISKSNKIDSIDFAKTINLSTHHKFLRKEIDIGYELCNFCKISQIEIIHGHRVKSCGTNYIIDFYLPEYKIAIEIDEFNHRDRDPQYEIAREDTLKHILKCRFLRFNPDDPNFTLSTIFGTLNYHIISCIK
ncbi:hypothetical protein EON71_00850 [bacterium]|nr:MAG: hypothetical protein EON71_00850 [bacterium]